MNEMKKVFKAKIIWMVSENHPDIKYVENPKNTLEYTDTYTLDTDYYDDENHMIAFMKHDLSLVAGGGYNTENIYDVKFDIEKIIVDKESL